MTRTVKKKKVVVLLDIAENGTLCDAGRGVGDTSGNSKQARLVSAILERLAFLGKVTRIRLRENVLTIIINFKNVDKYTPITHTHTHKRRNILESLSVLFRYSIAGTNQFKLWQEQHTMGSNCARTIDVTHDKAKELKTVTYATPSYGGTQTERISL